jgi:hypothetical protein
MPKIAIPLDSRLIGEMFLRRDPSVDISDWIEYVVRQYLDDTADDTARWSEAYTAYREAQVAPNEFAAEFGDRERRVPLGTSVSSQRNSHSHGVQERSLAGSGQKQQN